MAVTCFSNSVFQHTAARRRLAQQKSTQPKPLQFQHTAARRRLDLSYLLMFSTILRFQHTAARRRLGLKGV